MSATLLFRIAAVLLLLFAAAHTYGFLNFKPAAANGLAVRDAMDSVHFIEGGSTFSYGGFYRGLGLSCTLSMLFSAYLAWYLGELAKRTPGQVASLGWPLTALQLGGIVLSFMYFPAPPAIFSSLVTICLAWATWKTSP